MQEPVNKIATVHVTKREKNASFVQQTFLQDVDFLHSDSETGKQEGSASRGRGGLGAQPQLSANLLNLVFCDEQYQ